MSIIETIKIEEEKFFDALEKGLKIFNYEIKKSSTNFIEEAIAFYFFDDTWFSSLDLN